MNSNSSLNRLLAYGCLALSMSLVGTYVAFAKPLAMAMPVFLVAWLRFGIGGVAMLRWWRKPGAEPPMSGRTRFLVFLESFLGNFLFTIFMIYGVKMTGAVSAGIIMSAIPAVVAVMGWIFLKERISRRVLAAIVCGVVGIGMLALTRVPGPEGAASGSAWLGDLFVFCSVLCEGSYAVIGKTLTRVLSPKRISAIINAWGFALMTPMGLYLALHFDFTGVSAVIWLLLLFYGLAASVWTVWLWMTGLKSVPASRAGVFTVLLPISAAVVGVVALGEPFSGMQAVAFAIALAGLLLATLPVRSPARHPSRRVRRVSGL
ncbi:MAG: DMT family transporter [Candidimonas sp.]|nr:MAG: DMT family transporter [Candidimonas sp.]